MTGERRERKKKEEGSRRLRLSQKDWEFMGGRKRLGFQQEVEVEEEGEEGEKWKGKEKARE